MLVLTRKEGETIHIGSDIVVNVLQLRGNQVKIGIEAPKIVDVHRGEIYAAIKAQLLNTH